jgi:hypothetical protein
LRLDDPVPGPDDPMNALKMKLRDNTSAESANPGVS